MLLFVGLGNPGSGHSKNRHNIGFMAVDLISHRHNFSGEKSKFQGIIQNGVFGDKKVLILKPQTFMNKSGQSVSEAMHFYKLTPEDVVVFYDELDIPLGKIKVKDGGGAAGHNGIRSIIQHIGANFRRVRMGIGHPGHKEKVVGYVLSDFSKADFELLNPLLDAVASEAGSLGKNDASLFMTGVAHRINPNPINDRPKNINTKDKNKD
ncbi:MAG: aminoacyl-tRNA hydrolase [Sphingomonadales bacterium]|jgi:PTH1 family peptidyl-tRNA hydrolase